MVVGVEAWIKERVREIAPALEGLVLLEASVREFRSFMIGSLSPLYGSPTARPVILSGCDRRPVILSGCDRSMLPALEGRIIARL